MDEFRDTPSAVRLLLEHPTPWQYETGKGGKKSAIFDTNGNEVVNEGQVSPVVFDLIWAAYFDLLR